MSKKIRRDFFGDKVGDKKWAAVIGHSYGTVVAQSYAHRFPESVKKIVLSAPITPVCSLNWAGSVRDSLDETKHWTVFDGFMKTTILISWDGLPVTDDIGPIRDYLVSRGKHILNEIERLYWNVQFVGDEYSRLEAELKQYVF